MADWNYLRSGYLNLVPTTEPSPEPGTEGWAQLNEAELRISLPPNWLLISSIVGGVGLAAVLYITLKD